MSAHLEDAHAVALYLDRFRKMALCKGHSVVHTHLRKQLSGLEIVLYFLEDPRVSVSRTSDHYRVDSISVEIFLCLLRGVDVSITYYRYMHARVFLHLSDERPVGLACIHLAAGASVDGQSLYSDILQPLRKFHYYLRILIPSQTCLYGHRQLDGLDDLSCDLDHLVGLSHHSRACSTSCNLVDRTSEVDVHEVGSMPSGDFRRPFGHYGRIDHRLRDVAVYLYADGGFVIVCHQLFKRFAGVADESVGRNEFRIHHVRAELLAYETEGCIGHILHRRKKKRPVS